MTLARNPGRYLALALLLVVGSARAERASARAIGSAGSRGLVASAARGQALDPDTRTAARELARQGAEAFEREEYAPALDFLNRAYELFPAPSISVLKARSLFRLGRWVEALDCYEKTRLTALAEDAPEAFRQAVRDANREGEELRARVPRLSVHVRASGGPLKDLVVILDGKPVPAALLDVERPVDPGVHEATARAAGRTEVTRSVRVAETDSLALEITLEGPRPVSPSATTSEPSPTATPTTERSDRSLSRPWAWTALGTGAAGLAVSGITGIIALNKKSTLDRVCTPLCPLENRNDITVFRTTRTVSYVSFAVGLVGVGVGTYLLLSGSPARAHVGVSLGPGAASLGGTF